MLGWVVSNPTDFLQLQYQASPSYGWIPCRSIDSIPGQLRYIDIYERQIAEEPVMMINFAGSLLIEFRQAVWNYFMIFLFWNNKKGSRICPSTPCDPMARINNYTYLAKIHVEEQVQIPDESGEFLQNLSQNSPSKNLSSKAGVPLKEYITFHSFFAAN